MRILVTGGTGQLGSDVIKELKNLYGDEAEILAPSRDFMNIENTRSIATIMAGFKPNVVIHCAAYTNVDRAELKDNDECYLTNVIGTRNIADACKTIDAKLIYISSDYVFDGTKGKPYTINDTPAPTNFYGATKFFGEQAALRNHKTFIVRTSFVFGSNGNNFIKNMINIAQEKGVVSVVDDQYTNPTYTVDLAEFLVNLIITEKYGYYHAANEGAPSKYEVIKYVFEKYGIKAEVKRAHTSDFKTAAIRPLNTAFDTSSLNRNGFNNLPTWQDAIDRFINELKIQEEKRLTKVGGENK